MKSVCTRELGIDQESETSLLVSKHEMKDDSTYKLSFWLWNQVDEANLKGPTKGSLAQWHPRLSLSLEPGLPCGIQISSKVRKTMCEYFQYINITYLQKGLTDLKETFKLNGDTYFSFFRTDSHHTSWVLATSFSYKIFRFMVFNKSSINQIEPRISHTDVCYVIRNAQGLGSLQARFQWAKKVQSFLSMGGL